MSSLQKLLSNALKTKSSQVICKAPEPIIPNDIEIRPLPKPAGFQYVEDGYLRYRPANYAKFSHITNKKLPKEPTDIKGVDHAAYSHIERKQMYKKTPTVVHNAFFRLKYYPYYHHLSLVRKSNIAYTFSNIGGFPLNDRQLYEGFKSYKGPYSRNQYFKTTPHPKDTAVARAKFRKAVKKALFNALHEIVPETPKDIELVSGIWFFKFDASPRTEEDYNLITKDLAIAVKKVYKDQQFREQINQLSHLHNRNGTDRRLIRDAHLEVRPGSSYVPGYYPKLPFIKTTSLLA
ncbi:hypothetical protein FT663_03277 [Candidozyma haemuli var. vulneris]|uniref:Uncharacterized protein n=1 Tax=Candidozyma haemuli TaxID=45357 RepID=A0A2V1AMP5_9ASCO|nr:hypothetical protein CXQ85_003179 [[Candida] haemuloni]KAF3990233.1 hypothetical protein FT663_03277 [[Candida] haemuloni var. vulneris]KAF3990526.1 hypothetical protein FT662_02211 [[Candida] haemuloni var. vulneris]PVH19340.1 hypothetical protein CXQ85_003179 [[Candida] haemuloni]